MTSLNPASAVPLYAQIADDLLARIRAGEWLAGSRLPSENALAKRYGVGRPTLRQATETLVRRRMVERRRGAGTFVREAAAHVDLFSLGGTLASFSEQGIALETEWLSRPTLGAGPAEAETAAGRDFFVSLRCARVDREPVLLERIWMDAMLFADFDQLPLAGGSLSEVVRTHYRREPQSADQSFRVAMLSPGDAAALDLPVGAPILEVDRVLHFPTARNAVFVRMSCRTDRFTFSQHIGAFDA